MPGDEELSSANGPAVSGHVNTPAPGPDPGAQTPALRQRMAALIVELEAHDHRYYTLGQPTVSNEEYDRQLAELRTLEQANPSLWRKDSPTRRQGAPPQTGEHGTHTDLPTLRPHTVQDQAGFLAFAGEAAAWCATVQPGGVPVTLEYQQGVLQRAAGRRDGGRERDVTDHVRTVRDVPLRLVGTSVPARMEVHGVVFVSWQGFEQMVRWQEAHRASDADRFANPHSAAERSLFLPDSRATAHRDLSFLAQSIGTLEGAVDSPDTRHGQLQWLQAMGLPVAADNECLPNSEAACAWFAALDQRRWQLGHDTDGVLFQVNERGASGESAQGRAVVWTYSHDEARSEVVDIGTRVSRGSGLLVPEIQIHPVWVAGCRVDKVRLDSEQEVQRLDLRIGDRVLVRQIDGMNGAAREVQLLGRAEPFAMPKRCPSCHSEVVRREGMVEAWCGGNERCLAQRVQRIVHFASRQAMDMEGLGSELAGQLVYGRYVRDPADLYSLKARDLRCCLPRVNERSIKALQEGLDKSRQTTLERFLLALGLPEVGAATARSLVAELGGLDEIMQADQQRLQAITDIGPVVAASIQEFFASPLNRSLIQRLRKDVRWSEDRVRSQGPLQDKNLVLTGRLSAWKRTQLSEKLRALGARVSSHISANTDYLVCGESPGRAKLSKADAMNVKRIQEAELVRMIDEHETGEGSS